MPLSRANARYKGTITNQFYFAGRRYVRPTYTLKNLRLRKSSSLTLIDWQKAKHFSSFPAPKHRIAADKLV